MGVKNLWRLLLPTAHRISIETLQHQTLAIDASIWMTQIAKACRDPDTGRLLPNKPHVRIFLLRLMRLLYHSIKPVIVFDGIMPEVKRREIQRRKDRRERLWRDDDNGDGGGGALKRAAKKILVKQLKELREKEAKLKREAKKKSSGGSSEDINDDGGDVGVNLEEEQMTQHHRSSTANSNGALAAGFTLDDRDDNNATTKSNSKSPTKYKTAEDDEVISINSQDSADAAKQQFQSELRQFQQNGYNSENDWEMSMAIQASINDSITTQQTPTSSSPNNANNSSDSKETTIYNYNYAEVDTTSNPFDHTYYQSATNSDIASLPVETRHQWIESQKRAQRIQSRRECIQHAANPQDYSSTQLRNFLKGSKLSKRVGEIDKLVEKRKEEDIINGGEGGGGFGILEPAEAYAAAASSSSNVQHARPSLQRLRRQNNNQSNDDEDDDHELFTSSTNNDTSMKTLFGEDESEDEALVGGGFLTSSSSTDKKATANTTTSIALKSEEKEVVLLDEDSDNDIDLQTAIRESISHAKEKGISNTKQKDTAQPSTSATNARTKSKLLELSTAQDEWANFGGDEAASDDDVITETQVDSAKVAAASKAMALNASESDSDEDGQGNSFLTLGQATKRVYTSNVVATKAMVDTSPPRANDAAKQNSADTEEEEDDDEVDWEDGDSGNEHAEASEDDNEERKITPNDDSAKAKCDERGKQEAESSMPTQKEPTQHKNDGTEKAKDARSNKFRDEHDTIDLLSDDDDNDREEKKLNGPIKIAQPKSNLAASNDNEDEPLVIDSESSDNEFDAYQPNDPQAAALQHAQDTASRLTSWVGRAFQRAISAHEAEQKAHSPDRDERPMNEHIDLTAGDDDNDDAIDVDKDESTVSEASKQPALSSKPAPGSTPNHKSPKQQQQHQQNSPVLFDTSLEGLTTAHNAIMQEEKDMERDMSTITDEMKEDILKLLQLCGIPWVESPSEAEAQCAALEELGLVDGVVTEDSDIFVFGGKKVYKNFFNEQKYVEAYYARDIQKELALGKHQLVALAMLLGGDYTDGVKGVGIVNGMEILQAFPIDDSADGVKNGLLKFREWLDGFGDHTAESSTQKEVLFHKKHKSARTRWVAPADFPSQGIVNAYLKPAVDTSDARFSWALPDLTGLQYYCAETLGWEEAETDRVVNPVLKVIQSGSKQTRLESYFMRYEDKQVAGKVRSKRLQAVLHDIQGGDNDNEIESAEANSNNDEGGDGKDDNDTPKKKKRRKKKS